MKELNEAKVLAVGPGGLDKDGKRVACSVNAGDKVLIPQVREICIVLGVEGRGDGRRWWERIGGSIGDIRKIQWGLKMLGAGGCASASWNTCILE